MSEAVQSVTHKRIAANRCLRDPGQRFVYVIRQGRGPAVTVFNNSSCQLKAAPTSLQARCNPRVFLRAPMTTLLTSKRSTRSNPTHGGTYLVSVARTQAVEAEAPDQSLPVRQKSSTHLLHTSHAGICTTRHGGSALNLEGLLYWLARTLLLCYTHSRNRAGQRTRESRQRPTASMPFPTEECA